MPNFFTKVGDFFRGIWQSLSDGLLFLGGPLDLVVAALDIIITTLVFYFILKLFRDSRAWQLLRGILLIIVFAFVTSLLGLNTISFIFNNTISILAVALVVIFQPELRKTLEKLGQNRFIKVFTTKDKELSIDPAKRQLIESIVGACDDMSAKKTGALIIIERDTRLGELQSQENAVQLDAAVSATFLKQIFYKGSPLHDGAVLIRDGRVAAARIHVPLTDAYHLRHELGTRHRAAVGASELGDAIAVVVSEERGTISLAVDGRLYELGNADALRSQLYRLLIPETENGRRSFSEWLQDKFSGKEDTVSADNKGQNADKDTSTKREKDKRKKYVLRRKIPGKARLPRRQRFALGVFSFILAFFFWLYVQVTVDPVITKPFTVPLTYEGISVAEDAGYGIQDYPVSEIQITLKGRSEVLENIAGEDIKAYIDISKVDGSGVMDLPVEIETDTLLYTQTEYVLPISVRVNVYEIQP